MSKRALGKGLSALLGDSVVPSKGGAAAAASAPAVAFLGDREAVMVSVRELVPNPNQPRKVMKDDALHELAASIRQNGVLQPVLVRRREKGFELVAGERRFRAAKMAGLSSIPALVCTLEEAESLTVALLENIQRENLNAIEEAQAYRDIMERYGATHQELADMLGKNRSTVSNMLRLLALEEPIRDMVRAGSLSMGHARTLLAVDDAKLRLSLARRAARDGLPVRALELQVQRMGGPHRPRKKSTVGATAPHDPDSAAVRELETRLQHHLGAPVRISRKGQKGRIEIEFYSDEELERLVESMGVDPQL